MPEIGTKASGMDLMYKMSYFRNAILEVVMAFFNSAVQVLQTLVPLVHSYHKIYIGWGKDEVLTLSLYNDSIIISGR